MARVQILDEAVYVNALEEDMNQTLLASGICKWDSLALLWQPVSEKKSYECNF